GRARPMTTSSASASITSQTSCTRPVWPTLSSPPPGGSLYAWAHAPAGDATGVRDRPFTEALQPPVGSASISVPPAAGAGTPVTPIGFEAIGSTVPLGSTTVTRAGAVFSCQIE